MNESLPAVSLHLIVKNGEKYIRSCLSHVKLQTYPRIALRIFDNASSDNTAAFARHLMPEVEIISFRQNYGFGGGFNRSLAWSQDPYVVGLCVDVMLDPHFIEEAVKTMESDPNIGVLQGKVMRYDDTSEKVLPVIDTTGMTIFRSRRVINRGHGEKDKGEYAKAGEVFCYEGAVAFFRRSALEDVKMPKSLGDKEFPYEYLDEDFFWYADELDLGWRMRLYGWKNWYEPRAIAAHDRQTTKVLSKGWKHFVILRKTIPARKRILDFRNQRLAFIKNDNFLSFMKDARFWLPRELALFGYFLFFERSTLRAYADILRMGYRMLSKRRVIMRHRKLGRKAMERWFE